MRTISCWSRRIASRSSASFALSLSSPPPAGPRNNSPASRVPATEGVSDLAALAVSRIDGDELRGGGEGEESSSSRALLLLRAGMAVAAVAGGEATPAAAAAAAAALCFFLPVFGTSPKPFPMLRIKLFLAALLLPPSSAPPDAAPTSAVLSAGDATFSGALGPTPTPAGVPIAASVVPSPAPFSAAAAPFAPLASPAPRPPPPPLRFAPPCLSFQLSYFSMWSQSSRSSKLRSLALRTGRSNGS
mmetsp:Transcript_27333/g.89469  ORF Transcript_27333/g.89469 Transcript_27333/m.89469 type:complete len:245 (-) Transcript_27333:191-925(-)